MRIGGQTMKLIAFTLAFIVFIAPMVAATSQEILSIDSRGDDEYQMKFTNTRGDTYTFPLVSNEHGNFKIGDDDDDLHFKEGNSITDYNIGDDDYFLLEKGGVTSVWRFENYNPTDVIGTFKNLATGKVKQVDFTQDVSSLNGHNIYVSDTASMTPSLAIDQNGDGKVAGSFVVIYVAEGVEARHNGFIDDEFDMNIRLHGKTDGDVTMFAAPNQEIDLTYRGEDEFENLKVLIHEMYSDEPAELSVIFEDKPDTCGAYWEGWVYEEKTNTCKKEGASGCSSPFEYDTKKECEADNKDDEVIPELEDVIEYIDYSKSKVFVYNADIKVKNAKLPLVGANVLLYTEGSPLVPSTFKAGSSGSVELWKLQRGEYTLVVKGPDATYATDGEWIPAEVAFKITGQQVKVSVGLSKEEEEEPEPEPMPDAKYITVVGKHAPSSDVVNAANFAGAMKNVLGVSFTGMTNEQLEHAVRTGEVRLERDFIIRFVREGFVVLYNHGLDRSLKEAQRYLFRNGFERLALLGPYDSAKHVDKGDVSRWLYAELDEDAYPIEHEEDEEILPIDDRRCRNGCLKEGQCIPFGLRTKNGEAMYCDLSGKFLPQKSESAVCQNNYECLSNSCSNGACIDLSRELRENRSILQAILDWVRALF